MPVVTPFGELTLTDKVSLEAWLEAHNRRHIQYIVARGLIPPHGGVAASGGNFNGPVDADWMQRHTSRHVALATLVKDPMPSADTKVLSLPGKWKTEQELNDWHALHNRLHAVIDKVQTIAQSKPPAPGAPPGTGIIRPGHGPGLPP